MNKRSSPYWKGLILFALVSWRFWHFGPALDLPHDWRQADTAYYITDFVQHSIDLFYPAVCWMGPADTVILEFPLPEAIVAQFQIWFGESMVLSRAVFLIFFLLCSYYFYRIVQLLFDQEIAFWALVIFLSMPLAQFYSRAIHIDFFAQGCCYAVLYYCLRGIQQRSTKAIVLASVLACIAGLIKIPYLFYLAIPVLMLAYHRGALRWLLLRSLMFSVPILLFIVWQRHVYEVNSHAPDWSYILHYRKFDQNASWYFGVWEQRLALYHWKNLSLRLLIEAGGFFCLLLFPFRWFRTNELQQQTLGAWMLGLFIYLLLFFNLNVVHNYYQIPFLGPIAILTALGLRERLGGYKKTGPYMVLGLIVVLNTAIAEWKYYEVPDQLDKIASVVYETTSVEDLPIVVYDNFDCRNPRILGRARRRGWSLEEKAATPAVVNRLYQEEGATHLIVVGNTDLARQLIGPYHLQEMQEIKVQTLPSSQLSIICFELPYLTQDARYHLD